MSQKYVTKFPRKGWEHAVPNATTLAQRVARTLRVPDVEEFELDAGTGQFTFVLKHAIKTKSPAHRPDPDMVQKLGQVFVEIEDGIAKCVLVGTRHGVIRLDMDAGAKSIIARFGKLAIMRGTKKKDTATAKLDGPQKSEPQATEDELVGMFLSSLPKPDLVRWDETLNRNVPLSEKDLTSMGLIAAE